MNEVSKSVNWLFNNLSRTDVKVLDATLPKVGMSEDPDEFIMGIPGAIKMDLNNEFQDKDAHYPNTMPSPDQFEKAARALGINDSDTIIVYDRHGIYSSPRAWWLFTIMGYKQVFILDGGLPAWVNEGHPLESINTSKKKDGNFTVHPDTGKMVDYTYVFNGIGRKDMQIIDARSAGRFTGEEPEPRKDMRGGHIPSSTNVPINRVLQGGKFKSNDELLQVFNSAKAEDKELVFSCGSGITACVLAAAAKKSGFDDIKVFDGSWTEWALREELPVERGE